MDSSGTGELYRVVHPAWRLKTWPQKDIIVGFSLGAAVVTTLTFTEGVPFEGGHKRERDIQVMDLEPLDARERDEAARNFSFNEYI